MYIFKELNFILIYLDGNAQLDLTINLKLNKVSI